MSGANVPVCRLKASVLPCSHAEYEEDGSPNLATVKPLIDGGTEGFKGHARVLIPGVTPCFECTLWLFPPQASHGSCGMHRIVDSDAAYCSGGALQAYCFGGGGVPTQHWRRDFTRQRRPLHMSGWRMLHPTLRSMTLVLLLCPADLFFGSRSAPGLPGLPILLSLTLTVAPALPLRRPSSRCAP